MRHEDLTDTAPVPAQDEAGFAAEQRETLAKVYRLLLSLKNKGCGGREKQPRPDEVSPCGQPHHTSDTEAMGE